MFVQILHKESGKTYVIPASQVVVFNDDGHPVSLTYERDGLLVCTDAAQQDFGRMVSDLKINKLPNAK